MTHPTATIVIIDDVTPNRATVTRVYTDLDEQTENEVLERHASRCTARLAEGIEVPDVGERVWVRGEGTWQRVITARAR